VNHHQLLDVLVLVQFAAANPLLLTCIFVCFLLVFFVFLCTRGQKVDVDVDVAVDVCDARASFVLCPYVHILCKLAM
jgi:hypothetical protein